MALRLDTGDHGWVSHLDFRAWGGRGRRGKPLLQGVGRDGVEWMLDFTKVLDHLSPEAGPMNDTTT